MVVVTSLKSTNNIKKLIQLNYLQLKLFSLQSFIFLRVKKYWNNVTKVKFPTNSTIFNNKSMYSFKIVNKNFLHTLKKRSLFFTPKH